MSGGNGVDLLLEVGEPLLDVGEGEVGVDEVLLEVLEDGLVHVGRGLLGGGLGGGFGFGWRLGLEGLGTQELLLDAGEVGVGFPDAVIIFPCFPFERLVVSFLGQEPLGRALLEGVDPEDTRGEFLTLVVVGPRRRLAGRSCSFAALCAREARVA